MPHRPSKERRNVEEEEEEAWISHGGGGRKISGRRSTKIPIRYKDNFE